LFEAVGKHGGQGTGNLKARRQNVGMENLKVSYANERERSAK